MLLPGTCPVFYYQFIIHIYDLQMKIKCAFRVLYIFLPRPLWIYNPLLGLEESWPHHGEYDNFPVTLLCVWWKFTQSICWHSEYAKQLTSNSRYLYELRVATGIQRNWEWNGDFQRLGKWGDAGQRVYMSSYKFWGCSIQHGGYTVLYTWKLLRE